MNQTTQTPKKILIIEDEAEMCLLLDLLLNNENTSVEHVKTIAGAREFFVKEIPHLVLLDNRLPDGFGMEFLVSLKNAYPLVKVIMITGVDRDVEDVALFSGADIFLNKPFTKTELYNAVQQLLN